MKILIVLLLLIPSLAFAEPKLYVLGMKAQPSDIVPVPIALYHDGNITATMFFIEYDPASLELSSINFDVPPAFVTMTPIVQEGRLSIVIIDFFLPFAIIPSRTILTLDFLIKESAILPSAICPTGASFSDTQANSIPGKAVCGFLETQVVNLCKRRQGL